MPSLKHSFLNMQAVFKWGLPAILTWPLQVRNNKQRLICSTNLGRE